jgi:hypothetical protein
MTSHVLAEAIEEWRAIPEHLRERMIEWLTKEADARQKFALIERIAPRDFRTVVALLRAASDDHVKGTWQSLKCGACPHLLGAHSPEGCNAPGCLCSEGIL